MPGVFGEFAWIADQATLKKVTGTKESVAVLWMKHLYNIPSDSSWRELQLPGLYWLRIQSLPPQKKVARSSHCISPFTIIICSTFAQEESVYQRELLTVNKPIICEELVK